MKSKTLLSSSAASEAMSTEDFLRKVVFAKPNIRRYSASELPDAVSTQEYLRKVVFGVEIPPDESLRPQSQAQRPQSQAQRPQSQQPQPLQSFQRGTSVSGAEGIPIAGGGVSALRIRCRVNDKGKLLEKQEIENGRTRAFSYEYDDKGHLCRVLCDRVLAEEYRYNIHGQRCNDYRAVSGETRLLSYGTKGQLQQAGDLAFTYAADGSLSEIRKGGAVTCFVYGKDTKLDSVTLSDGATIEYRYEGGGKLNLMPTSVLYAGVPVLEYLWEHELRLVRCQDRQSGSTFLFHYGAGRAPTQVTIHGPLALDLWQNVAQSLGQSVPQSAGQGAAQQLPQYIQGDSITLNIIVDQVDSPRLLTLPDGTPVKRITYDSFGNLLEDTAPWLPLPLGFACGLADRFTGLTRFGFRDYDPCVGRFTAKDPLGDTGGDHDLWDYCVDDPVGRMDETGLFWWWAAKQFGKYLGGGGLIGNMLFPKRVNEPERIHGVRKKIETLEMKKAENKATDTDIEELEELKVQEKELETKFKHIYEYKNEGWR